MSEQNKKQNSLLPVVIISMIILIAVVIWRIAIFKPAPRVPAVHNHNQHEHLPLESPSETKNDTNQPRMTLEDIIRTARTWHPAFQSWYGKPAPDFTLTDITGKQHKLSQYRGKQVMLIFWATWCRPCIVELPHLIATRNIFSKDELIMLAISSEDQRLVKRFAADYKINYTVFAADTRTMPEPFNKIEYIPTTFFINPDGKIKLAADGTLSLGFIKAILQAE